MNSKSIFTTRCGVATVLTSRSAGRLVSLQRHIQRLSPVAGPSSCELLLLRPRCEFLSDNAYGVTPRTRRQRRNDGNGDNVGAQCQSEKRETEALAKVQIPTDGTL